jgi:hypothetical protein
MKFSNIFYILFMLQLIIFYDFIIKIILKSLISTTKHVGQESSCRYTTFATTMVMIDSLYSLYRSKH